MNRRTLAAVLMLVCVAGPAAAQPNMTSPETAYSYEQRLSAPVPPELAFHDEEGRAVTLADYFGKRPVLLVLAQYRCPSLCNLVLNGLVDALRGLPQNAGRDFDVVVVSFDAREDDMRKLVQDKKTAYAEEYARPGADRGFHFLTGEQTSIDVLTRTVGFNYAYSRPKDRFAHPSGLVVLTPDGVISRYFDGILYDSAELGRALDAARGGGIGKPIPTFQRVLLLCYDYDPSTGNYVFNVMNAVRLAGALTVVAIVAGLAVAFLRERRKRAAGASGRAPAGEGQPPDDDLVRRNGRQGADAPRSPGFMKGADA